MAVKPAAVTAAADAARPVVTASHVTEHTTRGADANGRANTTAVEKLVAFEPEKDAVPDCWGTTLAQPDPAFRSDVPPWRW